MTTRQDYGRALLKARFYAFLQYAFAQLHPTQTLSEQPYLEAFCYQLERCARGENRRLVVNMPPRHLKSFSLIALQAWMLGREPDLEILAVSYGDELSRAHTELFRQIVGSDWFVDLFPAFELAERGDRLDEIRTTHGGIRRAASVGGPMTGFGGDVIMCDDLTKAQDVSSSVRRGSLGRFIDEVLLTRFNDPARGVLISAQQRLHFDDIVETLRQLPGMLHMNFPAIAEAEASYDLYRERRWHRQVGDLLDPVRLPRSELEDIRARRPAVFAAQYQQRPDVSVSYMIDFSQVRFVTEVPQDVSFCLQFWDTATTASEDSDWSVGTCWAWRENVWYLIDLVRGRWPFPALKHHAVQFYNRHLPRFAFVESAATGEPLVDQLWAEGHRDFISRSVHHPKDVRFAAATGLLQSPQVAILDGQLWTPDFRRELAGFPFGRHDDIVDSVSLFADYAADVTPRVLEVLCTPPGMTPPRPRGRPRW
jgi:predicted phage terminase large subunit-like protein